MALTETQAEAPPPMSAEDFSEARLADTSNAIALDELRYPRLSYSWYVASLLCLAAIISYTDRQVLSLLVDPVRHDLHIDDFDISLLIGTSFGFIYALAGIPLGYLADRRSRRNLIGAGMVVWSLGTIACGFSRDFGELFASRILVGIGEAVLSPAAVSLIGDYFPPARRGTALGVYFAGIEIGAGASILLGGLFLRFIEGGAFAWLPFAPVVPWRLVLILLGLPGFILCLFLFSIREPIRRREREPAAGNDADTAGDGLGKTSLRWLAPLYLAVGIISLIENGVSTWAPSLIIRQFAIDPATVGMTLGIALVVGGGSGVLAGGVLADRAHAIGGWSGKIVLCLMASLVEIPVALSFRSGVLPAEIVGIGVSTFITGFVTAAGLSAILDQVPSRRRGLATSVSFFLNVALGPGVGPTTVVAATALFSPAAGLGGPTTLVAAAGALIVAAAFGLTLVLFRSRKPRAKS